MHARGLAGGRAGWRECAVDQYPVQMDRNAGVRDSPTQSMIKPPLLITSGGARSGYVLGMQGISPAAWGLRRVRLFVVANGGAE